MPIPEFVAALRSRIGTDLLWMPGVSAVVVDALVAVTVTEPVEYPNGDRSQYLDLAFLCRPVSPAAAAAAHVADDESLAVAWFAPDHLPDDLARSTVERLGHALGRLADPSAGPFFVR
ncbi:NUDIX hydrolase [Cellulosimicrobium cellulans]|uniref:NUDIX hydrolase n=1 Tax=Cellulosimicrobium cellulans TaxID=1710 RepID=UPI0036643E90